MTDAIDEVAHVAPSAVVEDLRAIGAETAVGFPDVLSHGPAADEPARHGDLRLDYWSDLYERTFGDEGSVDREEALRDLREGYLTAEQVASAVGGHAEQRRVVVWTTPTFRDRLFLWFLFHASRRADIAAERLATAEPRIRIGGEGERAFAPLRALGPEELRAGFDDIFYPEEIYVQAGAQLWERYASGSPREFALSVGHTRKFFPEIESFAEAYGGVFPTTSAGDAGPVELSVLDRRLLGALDLVEWRQVEDLLGRALRRDLAFIDDIALVGRLVDWSGSTEGEGAYVEGRRGEERAGAIWSCEFRLGDRGRRVLDEGIARGDEPPILWQGDVRVYAGDSPWTKVVDDEHWWFERVELAPIEGA